MVYAAFSYKRLSGSATSKLGKHNGHPACSYIVFFLVEICFLFIYGLFQFNMK